ncbi:MAG: methyltransferase domain-containing protein, partial [Candidatus Omnitrophica bacterium]|nr:methyltransferase domain-containing protein [Candidatus Omnitrophota bacterium]
MGTDEPLSLTEILRLIHLRDLSGREPDGKSDSWESGLVYFLTQLFDSENRLDGLFEYILSADAGSRLSDMGLEKAVYTPDRNSSIPETVNQRLEFFTKNPSVTNDAFYLWNHKGYQPMKDSHYLELKLREFRQIAGYFTESEAVKYVQASADLLSRFIARLHVDANMWVARKTPGQRPPWPVQAYLEEHPLEQSPAFRELSVEIAANMRNFYSETPLMNIQIAENAAVEQGSFPLLQQILLRESPALLSEGSDEGKWKLDYFSDMIYRVDINGKPYYFGSGLFVKINLPNDESVYLYDAHNMLSAFLEDFQSGGRQFQNPEHDHYDYHSDAYRYKKYQLVGPDDDPDLSEKIRLNPFLAAQNIPIASFIPYIRDQNALIGRNPFQYSWIGSDRLRPSLNPRSDEPIFGDRLYSFSEFQKLKPGGLGDVDLDQLTRGLGTGIDYEMLKNSYREIFKDKFLKLLPQYEMLAFFISDNRYIPPVLALVLLGDMLPEIIQSKADQAKDNGSRLSGIANIESFSLPDNLPEDYFILVPAFREESDIPQVIRDINAKGYMHRVIFVDDASPDLTKVVLREHQVAYISLRENRRKEGALADALELLRNVYSNAGKQFPKSFVAVDADTYLSAGKKNTEAELSGVIQKFEAQNLKAAPITISANLSLRATFFEYIQGVEWSLAAAKWVTNKLNITPDIPGGGTIYDIDTFKEVIEHVDEDFESRPLKMKSYMEKKSYKIKEISSSLRARTDIAINESQYTSERQKWMIGTFRGAPFLGMQRYIFYPLLWTGFTIYGLFDSPAFVAVVAVYTLGSSAAWKIKNYLSRKIFKAPDEVNITALDFILLVGPAIVWLAYSPYPILAKYMSRRMNRNLNPDGSRLAEQLAESEKSYPSDQELTASLKAVAADKSNSLRSGHIPKILEMIQKNKIKLKGDQVPIVNDEDKVIAWLDRSIADLHYSGSKKISKEPGKNGISLRRRNAYSLIYLPGVKKFVFMQSVAKNKKNRDIRWMGGTVEKKTGEEASDESAGYTETVVREIAEESGFEDGHAFEPGILLTSQQITGDYNPRHPKKITLYTTILSPEEELVLLEHAKALSEKRSELGVKKYYEWLQTQKEQQPGRGEVWDLILIAPETLTDPESLKALPVSKQFTSFIEEGSVQEYIRNIPEYLILIDLQKKTGDLITYVDEMGPYFSENLLPAPEISLSKELADDVVYRYDAEKNLIEFNWNYIKDYSQQQLDDLWAQAFLTDWYQNKLSEFTDAHFEEAADMYSDENFGDRIEEQDWPFSVYGPDWLKVQTFEDKDVLIAGSGDGAFEHYLMAASQFFGITAPRITGVDGSSKFIELSRQRAIQAGYNFNYIQSYFTDLSEIEGESYDVIYTAHTLYALPPELRRAALQTLYRKLRKGGRIIVFEPLSQLIGVSLSEYDPWNQFISPEWFENADVSGSYVSAPTFTGGLAPAAVTVSVLKSSGARLADQGKKMFSEFNREYQDFMQAAEVLLNAYPNGYDHNQMHPDGEELRSKYQRMVRKLRAFSYSWQLFGNEELSHELYEKSRDVVRIMQESEEGVFPIIIQYEQILADLQRGEWQDFSEDLGAYFTGNGLPVYRKLDDEAKLLQISLMKQHANDRLGQFEQEIQRIINRHRRAAAKDQKAQSKIHGIQLAVDDWFNLFREYPLDYPVANYVPENKRLIETDYPGYTPVYYTDPKVLTVPEAHPEDPDLIPKNLWKLSGSIDYTGPYPQNPVERTGIIGRGRWWYWGPNWMTEIIITRINPKTKVMEMLAVKRRDTGQWAAIVGTHDASRNFKEDMSEAVYSKLGVRIKTSRVQEIYKGYVHDPRNTDNAWAEGYVGHLHVGANHVLNREEFKLDRFILEAKWLPLDKLNVAGLYGDHSKHVQLLIDRNQDLLSGSRLSDTPLTDMPENAPNLNLNNQSLRLIKQIAEHRESPQNTDLAVTAGRQIVLMRVQSPNEVELKTVSGNENRTVRFPEVDIARPDLRSPDVMADAVRLSEVLTVFTAELTAVERSYLNVLLRLLEKNRIDDVVWVRSNQSGLYDASVEGIRRLVESETVGGRFYSVSEEELPVQIPRFAEGNRYVTYLIPETLNTSVLENIDLSDRASSWVYPEASGNDESGFDMPAIRLNALMGLIIQAADKSKEENRSFDQAAFRL